MLLDHTYDTYGLASTPPTSCILMASLSKRNPRSHENEHENPITQRRLPYTGPMRPIPIQPQCLHGCSQHARLHQVAPALCAVLALMSCPTPSVFWHNLQRQPVREWTPERYATGTHAWQGYRGGWKNPCCSDPRGTLLEHTHARFKRASVGTNGIPRVRNPVDNRETHRL